MPRYKQTAPVSDTPVPAPNVVPRTESTSRTSRRNVDSTSSGQPAVIPVMPASMLSPEHQNVNAAVSMPADAVAVASMPVDGVASMPPDAVASMPVDAVVSMPVAPQLSPKSPTPKRQKPRRGRASNVNTIASLPPPPLSGQGKAKAVPSSARKQQGRGTKAKANPSPTAKRKQTKPKGSNDSADQETDQIVSANFAITGGQTRNSVILGQISTMQYFNMLDGESKGELIRLATLYNARVRWSCVPGEPTTRPTLMLNMETDSARVLLKLMWYHTENSHGMKLASSTKCKQMANMLTLLKIQGLVVSETDQHHVNTYMEVLRSHEGCSVWNQEIYNLLSFGETRTKQTHKTRNASATYADALTSSYDDGNETEEEDSTDESTAQPIVLSAYEEARALRVKRNNEYLVSLGFNTRPMPEIDVASSVNLDSDEEYKFDHDDDDGNDTDE